MRGTIRPVGHFTRLFGVVRTRCNNSLVIGTVVNISTGEVASRIKLFPVACKKQSLTVEDQRDYRDRLSYRRARLYDVMRLCLSSLAYLSRWPCLFSEPVPAGPFFSGLLLMLSKDPDQLSNPARYRVASAHSSFQAISWPCWWCISS